jgi:hypothetical protein
MQAKLLDHYVKKTALGMEMIREGQFIMSTKNNDVSTEHLTIN